MNRSDLEYYSRREGLLTESNKNILEYIEFFRDDYLTIKRRKMNIRVLGMNLFHNYLKRCDYDVQLLMEINELQLKLENLNLTPYVKKEINNMLANKIKQYESSKSISNYITGIIEFERAIKEYKTTPEILENTQAITTKIKKFNPKFDPEKYILHYHQRSKLPQNPFVFDDVAEMSKRPRKRLKSPGRDKSIFDANKTEL